MGEKEAKATQSLSPHEERERKTAKDVLDRAEREIRHLTEYGVDAGALSERFTSAKTHYGDGRWSDAEMTCSEILILAKSMQAITSASMSAGGGSGSKKISDATKAEISRLIAKEVGDRVEAVARTLPTTSSIEEIVQTKIQEALVTGGLIQRLENIASQKAMGAVAGIPRFTAKDAQAAANLVVQRSLTQFLSSKDLGKKLTAAAETEITKALGKAEKEMTKALGAHLNTQIASVVDPLPTKKGVDEQITAAFSRLVKQEVFEDRVLELASERAKAEIQNAPDLMSEAASKIAREAADSLFKTHLRSKEFSQLLKAMTREVANEVVGDVQLLSAEDVEVIARRIGEESLTTLANSDVLREKMQSLGKGIVTEALSAEGLDKKVRTISQEVANATPHVTPEQLEGTVQQLDGRTKALEEKAGAGLQEAATRLDERIAALEEKLGTGLAETTKALEERTKALEGKLSEGLGEKVTSALTRLDEMSSGVPTKAELEDRIATARGELMTNEDFGEWIKDGVLAVIQQAGLSEERMAELEETFVTAKKAEKMARHEGLTAAMDMLETKEFTRRLVELLGDEEVREDIPGLGGGGEDLELQVKSAFAEQLESTEFADKVKEISGDAGNAQDQLVARLDKIEKQALPALVDSVLTEKLTEKLGGIAPEALEASIGSKVQEALATHLDMEALNKQILEIAQQSIGKIANTPEFKEMLDGKFKIVMNYLISEVIPKQIRRQMGG
jgi:adenylate kinase